MVRSVRGRVFIFGVLVPDPLALRSGYRWNWGTDTMLRQGESHRRFDQPEHAVWPRPIPGPVERRNVRDAPFDRCNREADARTAWAVQEEGVVAMASVLRIAIVGVDCPVVVRSTRLSRHI
jgi:hypothetical protein